MARAKTSNPYRQSFQRERNRIRRQIKRMLERGYTISIDLPKVPKKITAGSVRKLKRITTEKLYKTGYYSYYENGELKMVSGLQGRKMERQRAAKSASITRARRKAERISAQKVAQRKAEEFAERWERDRENIDRLFADENYALQFTKLQITKRKFEDVLSDKALSWPKTVDKIRNELQQAIETEGEDTVYQRLADNPTVLDSLEETFYKEGDHINPKAFNSLTETIKGKALSAEEQRESQERFENDLANHFDPDEI